MPLTQLSGIYAGFLHIGDPHNSSRRPGTRNDSDFTATVIGKLEQAAAIANDRNLIPIILGDLFDREHDTQDRMMTLLVRVLNKFNIKPFVLAGNHDLTETSLTDDTALAVLVEAEVVQVIEQTGVFLAAQIEMHDEIYTVAVGGTPYGMTIPNDVMPFLSEVGVLTEYVGWLTHEDIAFEGAYPGAMEPFEINGCSWVVNGHMHLSKRPLKAGRTIWHNPGNITRLSKDCASHIPSVWEMNAVGGMCRVPLKHVEDVFDAIKGKVDANADGATIDKTSAFVEMLKACTIAVDPKTQDGSVLMEDIVEACKEKKASAGATNILMTLHGMAVH